MACRRHQCARIARWAKASLCGRASVMREAASSVASELEIYPLKHIYRTGAGATASCGLRVWARG
eukprot:5096391-Prymnesium_polylepis.1